MRIWRDSGWLCHLRMLFLAGFLLVGCTAQLANGPPPRPGTYLCKTDFTTGGFQRSFRLYVPQGYNADRTYPLDRRSSRRL